MGEIRGNDELDGRDFAIALMVSQTPSQSSYLVNWRE